MNEIATSEASILTRQSMKSSEVRRLGPGMVAFYSSSSPDGDGPNEDAAALISIDANRATLAVADGASGLPGGEDAAAAALVALRRAIASVAGTDEESQIARDRDWGPHPLRTAILNGFEAANHRVSQLATGAATTMAVVEIDGESVRAYHAGDSMILLVGRRGRVRHQSVPHSQNSRAIGNRQWAMGIESCVGVPASPIAYCPLPIASSTTCTSRKSSR